MMPKKSKTFFIISNYNTDPEQYLDYCEQYHIYDQSPDENLKAKLKEKYEQNISFVQNTGHNISDYFRFFIDNYDNLPETMLLGKGNMIGRHLSKEYFDKVYDNQYYTYLHNDKNWKDQPGVAYHIFDGAFLEINNSWYVSFREHRYFSNYNDLLRFIYVDPIIPYWTLFSPGACHIVTRAHVHKYPKEFYENLMIILSYTYFPSEAHQIERLLNTIFLGNYQIQKYMDSKEAFLIALQEQEKQNKKKLETVKGLKNIISSYYKKLIERIILRLFKILMDNK